MFNYKISLQEKISMKMQSLNSWNSWNSLPVAEFTSKRLLVISPKNRDEFVFNFLMKSIEICPDQIFAVIDLSLDGKLSNRLLGTRKEYSHGFLHGLTRFLDGNQDPNLPYGDPAFYHTKRSDRLWVMPGNESIQFLDKALQANTQRISFFGNVDFASKTLHFILDEICRRPTILHSNRKVNFVFVVNELESITSKMAMVAATDAVWLNENYPARHSEDIDHLRTTISQYQHAKRTKYDGLLKEDKIAKFSGLFIRRKPRDSIDFLTEILTKIAKESGISRVGLFTNNTQMSKIVFNEYFSVVERMRHNIPGNSIPIYEHIPGPTISGDDPSEPKKETVSFREIHSNPIQKSNGIKKTVIPPRKRTYPKMVKQPDFGQKRIALSS